MSLPNIPDMTPIIALNREDALTLLLASIAMEEIGLSHLLNAEGEKIQAVLAQYPTFDTILKVNRSVEKNLRNVIKNQMLLQFKLEDVLELIIIEDDDDDDEG